MLKGYSMVQLVFGRDMILPIKNKVAMKIPCGSSLPARNNIIPRKLTTQMFSLQ